MALDLGFSVMLEVAETDKINRLVLPICRLRVGLEKCSMDFLAKSRNVVANVCCLQFRGHWSIGFQTKPP